MDNNIETETAPTQEARTLNFGQAIEELKAGRRCWRKGWNGKGMWLSLVKNGHYDVGISTIVADSETGYGIELSPWIGMKTADDKYVPWLASQTDMLAEDWESDRVY
jgi:hypothetical protein